MNLSNTNITAINLTEILIFNTQLEEINLTCCTNLSDLITEQPDEYMNNSLKTIDLSYSNISAKNLVKVIAACPNLEKLILIGCENLQDDIGELLEGISDRKIREIFLSGSIISAKTLIKINKIISPSVPVLISLQEMTALFEIPCISTEFKNITNRELGLLIPLMEFCDLGKLEKVKSIYVSNVDIKANVLAKILIATPNLEYLSLYKCNGLTDDIGMLLYNLKLDKTKNVCIYSSDISGFNLIKILI